jgi:hypothetical protein
LYFTSIVVAADDPHRANGRIFAGRFHEAIAHPHNKIESIWRALVQRKSGDRRHDFIEVKSQIARPSMFLNVSGLTAARRSANQKYFRLVRSAIELSTPTRHSYGTHLRASGSFQHGCAGPAVDVFATDFMGVLFQAEERNHPEGVEQFYELRSLMGPERITDIGISLALLHYQTDKRCECVSV